MKYKAISVLASLLMMIPAFQSCQEELEIKTQESEGSFRIPSSAGTKIIEIEATGDWTACIKGADQHWATIDRSEGNGNSSLTLTYKANDSFSRMCRLIIEQESSAKVDTIFVKQYGKKHVIEFSEKKILFPVVQDKVSVPLNTNFTNAWLSQADITIAYEGESKDWITAEMDLPNTALTVSNTVNDQIGERYAEVIFSYQDGWEEKHELRLPISQSGNRAANGKLISISELKSMITSSEGSKTIEEDVIIEGIVINDHDNPNAAMNPNLTQNSIDYDINYKTTYLQTDDASEGLAIIFDKKTDNICNSRSKVKISLKDALLEKFADPERYVISKINATYLTALDTGAVAALPEKIKAMNELTDKDVFTFVTLKDCEIAVDEGSYTAINEGYCSSYNTNKFDTWPLLIRDIAGNQMHLMTNIACPYRRDGSGLPLGSGKISGIIVHDRFQRFEENGYIGKYQIRHLSEDDINLAKKQEEGFSKILVQWTTKIGNDEKVNNQWTLKPTTGSGIFMHSTGGWMSGDHSYMHPGPVDGSENKGLCKNAAWASNKWINGDSFHYWLMTFSTKDIESNMISLQINTLAKIGGPRYWAVETSIDEGNTWKRCAEYTVPDLVDWSNTLYTQIPGGKSLSFNLPQEICGKENVMIRLIPTKNAAGSKQEYSGAPITNRNIITYAAIRYNK